MALVKRDNLISWVKILTKADWLIDWLNECTIMNLKLIGFITSIPQFYSYSILTLVWDTSVQGSYWSIFILGYVISLFLENGTKPKL